MKMKLLKTNTHPQRYTHRYFQILDTQAWTWMLTATLERIETMPGQNCNKVPHTSAHGRQEFLPSLNANAKV